MENEELKKCPHCGKGIDKKIEGLFEGYCSFSCLQAVRIRSRIHNLPRRKCVACETEFQPAGLRQKFCSSWCRQNPHKKGKYNQNQDFHTKYNYVDPVTKKKKEILLNAIEARIAQQLAITIHQPIETISRRFKKYGYGEKRIRQMMENPEHMPGFIEFVTYLRNEAIDTEFLKTIWSYLLLKGVEEATAKETKKDKFHWVEMLGKLIWEQKPQVPKGKDYPDRQLDQVSKEADKILNEENDGDNPES